MNQPQTVNVKDINGNWVIVKTDDITLMLVENTVTILGVTIAQLIRFRVHYLKRGGAMPITEAEIDRVFSQ